MGHYKTLQSKKIGVVAGVIIVLIIGGTYVKLNAEKPNRIVSELPMQTQQDAYVDAAPEISNAVPSANEQTVPTPTPPVAQKPQTIPKNETPKAPVAPPTMPPTTTIANVPLASLFNVNTRCFEAKQIVYTDVIYNSTAANTTGVNLLYRLELVASGMSLNGYYTSQDFSAFVDAGTSHISAPNGYSFEYPIISPGSSLSVRLTTLQPFNATTIRPITNIC